MQKQVSGEQLYNMYNMILMEESGYREIPWCALFPHEIKHWNALAEKVNKFMREDN